MKISSLYQTTLYFLLIKKGPSWVALSHFNSSVDLFYMFIPSCEFYFLALIPFCLNSKTSWDITVRAVLHKLPHQLQSNNHPTVGNWPCSPRSRITLWCDFIRTLTRFIFWHCATAIKNVPRQLPDKAGGKTVPMLPFPFLPRSQRSIHSEFSQFKIQICTLLLACARFALTAYGVHKFRSDKCVSKLERCYRKASQFICWFNWTFYPQINDTSTYK